MSFCRRKSALVFFQLAFSLLICSTSCNYKKRSKITFKIKDEFGDEATVIRDGGTLQIYCTQQKEQPPLLQIRPLQPNTSSAAKTLPVAFDPSRALFAIPISNHGPAKDVFSGNYEIFCKYHKNKKNDASTYSYGLRFGNILCDALETATCGDNQVCLLSGRRGGGHCGKIQFCETRGDATEKFNKVCYYDTEKKKFERISECEALTRNLNYWPQIEITDAGNKEILCKELKDYWRHQGRNLTLRDIITINDTNLRFTLRPRTRKCTKGRVTCTLKTLEKPRITQLHLQGSCEEGWTVNVTDIWRNSQKTKLICIYSQDQKKQLARWQFYLYPTIALKTFENNLSVCNWPKWLYQPSTSSTSGTCRKSVKFNFPPALKLQKFHFLVAETSFAPRSTSMLLNSEEKIASQNEKKDETSDGKSSSVGPIVGGAVCGVVFVTICIVGLIWFRHWVVQICRPVVTVYEPSSKKSFFFWGPFEVDPPGYEKPLITNLNKGKPADEILAHRQMKHFQKTTKGVPSEISDRVILASSPDIQLVRDPAPKGCYPQPYSCSVWVPRLHQKSGLSENQERQILDAKSALSVRLLIMGRLTDQGIFVDTESLEAITIPEEKFLEQSTPMTWSSSVEPMSEFTLTEMTELTELTSFLDKADYNLSVLGKMAETQTLADTEQKTEKDSKKKKEETKKTETNKAEEDQKKEVDEKTEKAKKTEKDAKKKQEEAKETEAGNKAEEDKKKLAKENRKSQQDGRKK